MPTNINEKYRFIKKIYGLLFKNQKLKVFIVKNRTKNKIIRNREKRRLHIENSVCNHVITN